MQTIADAFRIFAGVCLPILAVAAAGWAADRKFRLDLSTLVKLNIYLFVPAFVFVRVYESSLDGAAAGRIILFTTVMIALMLVLSAIAARLGRLPSPSRKALYLATMFYNCGNFGIPLVTLAFGAEAQSIQVFVLMTMNVATFTVGIVLAAIDSEDGMKPASRWRRVLPVLRQPSLYAIAAAALLREMPVELEKLPGLWIPLSLIAAALVPVALVTLGVQLSHTTPPPICGRLGTALVIRLAAGPLLAAVFAVFVFRFDWATARVLIAGAAAPTAINTALIAHEFHADSRFAAAAVFYSTLLSILTVSILLAVLEWGG